MADLILPADLAVWDPLGGTPEPLMTGHDGVCVHTMAGSFAGTDAMFHQNGWGGTESTVGIAGSGFTKQWVSWNRQADANLQGNPRWLSIECADAGESFPPLATASDESPPLTGAQIERIIRLCVYWCDVRNHQHCPSTWQCHREGIPARFIANSCERGIGTHYHGIPGRGLVAGCPRWSDVNKKICPRMVRHRQVRDLIVPEVARRLSGTPNPEDDDMMFLHSSSFTGVSLIEGGIATWLSSTAQVEELKNQGILVKVMNANESDARRFITERTSPATLAAAEAATHEELVAVGKAIEETLKVLAGTAEPPVEPPPLVT